MEEIVIPDLDDDDDETFQLPSFSKSAFGNTSTSSLPDLGEAGPSSRKRHPSTDAIPKYGGPSSTPVRPGLNRSPASIATSTAQVPQGISYGQEGSRLGKFSNGSSSSIVTPGTSIGSTSGFLASRKGSLASIKNAFRAGAAGSSPVPPVPSLDFSSSPVQAPGYPALRNPFSKDAPASPIGAFLGQSPRTTRSGAFASPQAVYERKVSLTNSHAAQRSHGGRSVASHGSSSIRGSEDHPMPALLPIPMRSTPSRLGRQPSESGSTFSFGVGMARANTLEDIGEGKTPGEEALRVIFKEFRTAADTKIARICGRPLNTQPSLSAYLEPGSDTQLDALTTSLAHCSRRHPRRVIDLLHTWCRAHCEGIGASEVRAHLDRSLGLQMRVEDAATLLGARKSSAAKYLLNRTLIELVRSTPKEALGDELGMMLESNAFTAYRGEKGDDGNPQRKAVMELQIELLGELSQTREMSKYTNLAPSKETDIRVEHLLRGMRHLKLRVYPEPELEASSEFIQCLASLYSAAGGQAMKNAYAETLTSLLHPVAETSTAEVNHPMWSKAVALILQRALAAAAKPKTWAVNFPLVVTALSVSPREVFMQHWQANIDTVNARMKDRTTRTIALNAFLRLLWIYLNRVSESLTSTRKRLDNLMTIFFSSNGALFPFDIPSEFFAWILHYVMVRELDYGVEFLKDFLRNIDSNISDPLVAIRAASLIRAISATLRAVEEDRPAAWPAKPDFTRLPDILPASVGDVLPDEVTSKDDVPALLERCGVAVSSLLILCDRLTGSVLLSSDSVNLSSAAASSSITDTGESITRKHGDVYASYSARHEPVMRLMMSVLDACPRLLSGDTGFAPIANILSRCTFSADPRVCDAAASAMRRISSDPTRCLFLVNTYREFIFETRHIFKDTFIGARLLEGQLERVVQLWVDLLHSLVHHQRLLAAQLVEESPGKSRGIGATALLKIEVSGMFLLCSTSLPLRKLAGQVLCAAQDLEGTQRRPSAAFRYSRIVPPPEESAPTRIAQLYAHVHDDAELARIRKMPWFSSADRHRFDIVGKDKVLPKLAESDQIKDTILWLSILPHFVGRICEQLPQAAAELRSILIPIVIRLQVQVAGVGNVSSARAAATIRGGSSHRSSSDVAILADHWRTYLSLLCVTMPSLAIPPATPPIPRTKDAIILTPDTIGTPVIYHYLTSLLAWEDPRFKDAAVYAMGTTGQAMSRPLSEVLLGVVRRLADTRKTSGQNSVWTSVAHVFRLISPLILDVKSNSHLANLSSMISFVKILNNFLSDKHVREDYDLQGLRRSFCVVVENLANALGKLDSGDRFLGEELRGSIFKLCYDWCHIGRRPDVAKARESQMLQAAAGSYKGDRDRAQYLDDLQAKTKLLSAAAAEAMAGLCQGKLVSSTDPSPATQASSHIVDPLIVLRWIRGMFTSSSQHHHETARNALHALIKHNWHCARLLDEVLHQSFGEGEQFNLESSFFGIVADLLIAGSVELPIEQICCLALSKLGHPAADIRQRAFQLVVYLLPDAETRLTAAGLLPRIAAASPYVYTTAQREIAEQLADVYADHAITFLAESASRLSQLEAPRRTSTLSIIPAWVQYFELAITSDDITPEQAAQEQRALSNLMYLAVRFLDDHMVEVRAIFLAFAGLGETNNITALTKYLFEQGGQRRSPDFVHHAQRVLACLADSPVGGDVFNEICDLVEPSAMASITESEVVAGPSTSLADLDAVMTAPSNRTQTFSTGQLALLFVGELLPFHLQDHDISTRLPTLLHVAITHCDCPAQAIREQSQAILFQVLRAWIHDTSSTTQQDAASSAWLTAEHKISALSRSPNVFWRNEDVAGPDTALLAPPKMTAMAMKIIGILVPLHPQIRQTWGQLALTWATSCPIRHIACRSFQIFRILSPTVDPKMVSDILARLSSTIGSASNEIQAFNLEVLRTLAAIAQNTTTQDMALYPQIFWCSMACLTTPAEDEFKEVIELLSHVLDKTNLSDPAVLETLESTRPPDWVGPPAHLQALLLAGLRSSKTSLMAFDLIRRLSSVSSSDLIDSAEERLLHGFVSALPWMLHSMDVGEPNEDLAMMAMDLAHMAENEGNLGASRLLTSFAGNKFRSKDDFPRQACSLLRDYMGSHELSILSLLLSFVLNNTDWMREKGMQILQQILLCPEARQPLLTHGMELLQPLLQLVSTKHATPALGILDMPIVAAAQAEALTSSMMATGTIFGPISESGWSVANAKEVSSLMRENVTAVFNTCAKETRAASAHFSVVKFADVPRFDTPNLQPVEDLPPIPTSAGLSGISQSMAMGMSSDNASMGDLVNALHSLGQFFGEGADEGDTVPRMNVRHQTVPSDSISERRVRAIMARGRKLSITSPVYENMPRSFESRHRHNPSEAFTESSTTSSTDGLDSANRGRSGRHHVFGSMSSLGRDGDINMSMSDVVGARSQPIFSKHHVTHPSTSSITATSDFGADRTENLFALDESGFGSGEAGISRGNLNDSNTSISNISESEVSEQSTPVMMRAKVTTGSGKPGTGWSGYRLGAVSPSPSARR